MCPPSYVQCRGQNAVFHLRSPDTYSSKSIGRFQRERRRVFVIQTVTGDCMTIGWGKRRVTSSNLSLYFTPLVTFYRDDLLPFLLKVAKYSFVQKYYLSTTPPCRGYSSFVPQPVHRFLIPSPVSVPTSQPLVQFLSYCNFFSSSPDVTYSPDAQLTGIESFKFYTIWPRGGGVGPKYHPF